MNLRKQFLIATAVHSDWLPIGDLAEVWASSEDAHYPVEAALLEVNAEGWRAAAPGLQVIRVVFDRPQDLRLIQVVLEEADQPCVQEFSLHWSADRGQNVTPIARQQCSFDPAGVTRHCATYQVALRGASVVELQIVPDLSHRPRIATLTTLRFG